MNPLTLYSKKENSLSSPDWSTVTGHFRLYPLEEMLESDLFQSKEPIRINNFEMIWVKDAVGTITVDLKRCSLSANTLYHLAPGQYRRLEIDGAVQGHYISMSPEFLHLTEGPLDFSPLAARQIGGGSLPVIHPDPEMEDLVLRMYREYNSHDSRRTEILRSLVKVFMIYWSRKVEQSDRVVAVDKSSEIVRKFMELLKKHFATKKLVANYADEMCITPNYLNAIVKKHTGFPVRHHIQQYLVLEAKRQAMYGGLRMKEVADRLGFADHAHFSKFFKNYGGINFSTFKKGIQA